MPNVDVSSPATASTAAAAGAGETVLLAGDDHSAVASAESAAESADREMERAWSIHKTDTETSLTMAREQANNRPADGRLAGQLAVIEGWSELRQDRLESAMRWAVRANEELVAAQDVWAGRALLLLGNVCSEFGLRFQATSHLSAGDLIAQRIGDETLRAEAAFGMAHEQIGHRARLEQFQAARQLFESSGRNDGIVICDLNIAQELSGLSDHRAAAAVIECALARPEIGQMRQTKEFALAVAAACHARLGDADKAARRIADATTELAAAGRVNVDVDLAVVQALTALGRVDESVARLHELREGASVTPAQRVRISLELATAYETVGRIADAYYWLRQHVTLNAEHQDIQARERAQALVAMHRVQETESRLVAIEEQHRLLREQAQRDGLTGLYNRVFLLERLGELCADDPSHPAVMLLDLDRFKHVNDTYGHLAGDAILELVARQCVQVVGGLGIVGRYGGDELAVVLPDGDPDVARGLAARLVATIGEYGHIERDGQRVGVTISVGLATAVAPVDPTRLLQAADDALYAAKAAGRNQFSSVDVRAGSPVDAAAECDDRE